MRAHAGEEGIEEGGVEEGQEGLGRTRRQEGRPPQGARTHAHARTRTCGCTCAHAGTFLQACVDTWMQAYVDT